MQTTVFQCMLLLLPTPFVGAAMVPPPDAPLPRAVPAIVRDLERTDSGMRGAIDEWRAADPRLASAAAPEPCSSGRSASSGC
jgi:hypothetical protein